MANYDEWKQKYSALNDNQKQKWNDKISWMDANSEARQFTERYNQEMNNNQQSNNNSSNFNNQNGTNWQNQTQTPTNPISQQPVDMTMEEYRKSQNNQTNQVSPELDQSKFNQDPWKITVQEWTAQQTGKPDYWISTDARLNEMKGNLDHYFATSPRMFSDRETFNRVFEYNTRESDAQKQLLDSYWKRKEDMDKASQYTSWESIMNWLKNSQITTDQLNLIKENDPEAYRKWQELQEEEIKKRIVNDIVPPLMSDIANQINDMINMLWIQAQEALDIEWIYNDTMDRTWAYQTLEDANRTVRQIEAITNKKTAIMNRYAASTWGTVSDALSAARMQKAIAPYNEQLQGLQYQYQDYSNLYSQKSATALQAANVRALQANENQRIWNQKCQALGFATSALSYRTPEQQAQLRLQEQQAQNDMQLLQQSRLNDLNRYNQYATAKMQNQLQQELTDLSVEDEAQLKANLNNALSDYYKNYGDIIQRSQAQAVEDIMAYAKKKWISVAQALTENFIKPLQNKAEYKQKIASDYGMIAKQSIGTINWRSVIMTTNPNWSISYQYINDDRTAIESTYTVWDTAYVKLYNGETMTAEEYNKQYWGNIKAYNQVDSRAFTADPISTWYEWKTLYDFLNDPKNKAWNTWWQCAAFVNRYLESIWVGKYYGLEDVKTRENRCNSDTPQVWTIAVFDYNHYTDWKNYGHVAIVTKTYADWSFDVIDSNYDTKNPWKITKRHINAGTSSLKWFFDPSQPPRTSSTAESSVWWLTTSQLDSLAKDYIDGVRSYSDIKATYWDDVLNAVWLTASILKESWYEKSKIITDPAKILSTEQTLMSKFNTMNDGNRTALAQATKMQQALDKIDPKLWWSKLYNNASTQVIITAFNKLLDENSVVRESEYARTPEGLSYLDRMQWKLDKFVNWWAGMTFESLKSMVDLANEFTAQYQKNQDQLAQLIRNQAQTFGLNEANILPIDVIQQLDNPTARTTTTWPINDTQKYFDWLQSTLPTNTWNITLNAMYSKVDFILNGN